MSSILKKSFDISELKWGSIKRYDGKGSDMARLTFCSYVVFFIDDEGMLRNAVSQNEVYDNIEKYLPLSLDNIDDIKVGEKYIQTISDTAAFILYRAFDIKKKKKYSIKDVEDAIMACDMLFFKDKEKIRAKRNVGYQKVKRI